VVNARIQVKWSLVPVMWGSIGAKRRWLLSRGTQIPEYVLQGCLAAFKSRNRPSLFVLKCSATLGKFAELGVPAASVQKITLRESAIFKSNVFSAP
jgi:hypothetical protein